MIIAQYEWSHRNVGFVLFIYEIQIQPLMIDIY